MIFYPRLSLLFADILTTFLISPIILTSWFFLHGGFFFSPLSLLTSVPLLTDSSLASLAESFCSVSSGPATNFCSFIILISFYISKWFFAYNRSTFVNLIKLEMKILLFKILLKDGTTKLYIHLEKGSSWSWHPQRPWNPPEHFPSWSTIGITRAGGLRNKYPYDDLKGFSGAESHE